MGPEKLIGYPLALLGSVALLAQPPTTTVEGGSEGAGGNVRMPRSAETKSPAANPMTVLPTTTAPSPAVPAAPRPPGRPSAESAELRALRLDEGSIFPELGHSRLDLYGAAPIPSSCDNPDYELTQSVEAEIPTAGDWLRGLKRPDIAIPRDPKVARYIRHFATSARGRETFATWLRRSGAYRNIVTAAINRRNLPIDLMAIMFVESGCWPNAVSSAGAVGLWQFMPQTAQAYGLTVRPGYDERRNIWKSTDAALTHLADLHNQFESWHLALAAYNAGYQQMLNRMQATRTEDFFSLSKIPDALPRETALYVPKVLAVAVILRNLDYFGFDDVELLSPMSASRIEVPPNTRLSLLARAAGTSLKRIKELNPQILGDTVPDTGSPTFVHLPNSGLARAKTMLPRLLEDGDRGPLDLSVTSDFDWGRDEVDANWRTRLERTKPGNTASEGDAREERNNARDKSLKEPSENMPARRMDGSADNSDSEEPKAIVNGTAIESVRQAGSRSKFRSSETRDEQRENFAYQGEQRRTSGADPTYYRIKPGDTLSELAQSFKVPLKQLVTTNSLSDPSRILAGSRLRIASNRSEDKRR